MAIGTQDGRPQRASPVVAMKPAQSTWVRPGDRADREVELAADQRDDDGQGQDADDGLVAEDVL